MSEAAVVPDWVEVQVSLSECLNETGEGEFQQLILAKLKSAGVPVSCDLSLSLNTGYLWHNLDYQKGIAIYRWWQSLPVDSNLCPATTSISNPV